MTLSIVVPFHNERQNIPLVLERFLRLSAKHQFELICVDDASSDGSGAIFETLLTDPRYHFARYIPISKENHRGYGHAIMTGVRVAKGSVIAWTHSDLQTDPEDVFRAFALYEKNPLKPIVKGRRIKRPFKDAAFSAGMALLSSIVLRRFFYEINAQPKLFSKDFLDHLKDAPDDFSLDLYLLYQAKRHHIPIQSIPVLFLRRIYGESSWAHSFASKKKTIERTIKYIFALGRRPR